MSVYTIRVELSSSQYSPDFEILHREMQKEGFSKLIKSDDGKIYHLPRGEYYVSTLKSCSQVLDDVKKAVRATGRLAEILVTEASRIKWSGLIEKK